MHNQNPSTSPPCPDTLCNSSPKHLHPFLLSAAAFPPLAPGTPSPTAIPQSCAAVSPDSKTELLTTRHKLPAFPAVNSSHLAICDLCPFKKDPARHKMRGHRQEAPGANDKAWFKDHTTSLLHQKPAPNLQNICSNHQLFLLLRDKEGRLSHPVGIQREKLSPVLLPPSWQGILAAGWHINILHEALSKLIPFMLLFSGQL